MESLPGILGFNLALACVIMVSVWVVSVRIQDASIVDIVWGAAGATMALSTFLLADGVLARKLLVTAMTLVWGGRLAIHIGRRKWGKEEDFRYAAWRAERPDTFARRSLVTIFLFQGLLIWAISLPAQIAQLSSVPTRLTTLDFLGLGFWVLGFGFEAVADRQLRTFLAEPTNKGKVMDRGLWKYSRHPNYFGDALIWWGIFLVAAAVPWGWITFFSPFLMTFFLFKVSGVPMLEKALAERREGYREYMQRTSPFFPWPPRRRSR
jgi:steroid 5-alpha reductase family enzyme